jgi:anti-anti-sigma regulatory factor
MLNQRGKNLIGPKKECKMAIINYSDNIILVELPPEPDIRSELDQVMKIVRQETDCNVMIDLSKVDILLSVSISGFVQLYKLLTAADQHLIFFNASELTRSIFKLTCVDCFFEFADDLPAATEALNIPCEPQDATHSS